MPYKLTEQDGKFCVAKDDGSVVKCHPTKNEAEAHLAALYANVPDAGKATKDLSIPGSMESFQSTLRDTISRAGLFGNGFDLVATLPDAAIVCAYTPTGKAHYSVGYGVSDAGISLGSVTPVELATVVSGPDQPSEDQADDDYEGYDEEASYEEDDDEEFDDKHPGHNQASHGRRHTHSGIGARVSPRIHRTFEPGGSRRGRIGYGAAAGAGVGLLAAGVGAAPGAAIGAAAAHFVGRRRDRRGKGEGLEDGMEFKSFEVKSDGEPTEINGVKGWTFDGYASVWDIRDHEGDTVRRGAFSRTLSEGLPLVKYEHGATVGKVLEAVEDDKGLLVRGFVPIDDHTEFMRKLMKIGAVAKMSYGWKPYPEGARSDGLGGRELTDIKLYEVSPVAVPMLDQTDITNVKSLPNGLPAAPFEEQMSAVSAVLLTAKAEAEALVKRRERNRDGVLDWPISAKCAGAIAELGAAAGETFVATLQAEVKAARAVSRTRKRYLASLIQAARAFVESLPEGEKDEFEGLLEPEASGGNAKPKADSPLPSVDPGSREARARDLAADYLAVQLGRRPAARTVEETQ
jgi:HK97 family phage prohead protease